MLVNEELWELLGLFSIQTAILGLWGIETGWHV